MFSRKYFYSFLGAYFVLRLFSYFFDPPTALQTGHILNTLVAAAYLVFTAYLLIRKNIWGWCLVALEIILGGAGGFLSIGPIGLRTCLLITSMTIFDVQKALEGKYIQKLKDNLGYTIFVAIFFVIAGLSAIHGIVVHHPLQAVFADTIPYLFLLYFWPLKELVQSEKFKQVAYNALIAAVIGNAAFILFTLAGFSSKLFTIQGTYYHWYRDVALGKVTELGLGFYRLVLNEQLLLPAILLLFWNKLVNKNEKENWVNYLVVASTFVILSVNLTRIYFLALTFGALLLIRKNNWKRWLAVTGASVAAFVLIFSSISLAVSRGQSLGWELFGLRFQGIIRPTAEDSSLSRILLFPKEWEKIKNNPFMGYGLADTVTVWSPVQKTMVTTSQFDWGYLEIWDELGILGLIVWLAFLVFAMRKLTINRNYAFSAVAALLVINITSPGLFHLLGILLIATLLSF